MISPKSASSTRKLEAAYAGKSVIDRLSSQVNADSWRDPFGNYQIGREYQTMVNPGNFRVHWNYEIPSGFNAVIPEEQPRKLNIKVDFK